MKRRCKFLWKTKVRKESNTSFKTIFGILQQSTIGFHSISNFSKNDQDLKHSLCKLKRQWPISKISKILRDKPLPTTERGGKHKKKEGHINFINF